MATEYKLQGFIIYICFVYTTGFIPESHKALLYSTSDYHTSLQYIHYHTLVQFLYTLVAMSSYCEHGLMSATRV